jgi:hypothetical protein
MDATSLQLPGLPASKAAAALESLRSALDEMKKHCGQTTTLCCRAEVYGVVCIARHLVEALQGDEFCIKVLDGEMEALQRAVDDMNNRPLAAVAKA